MPQFIRPTRAAEGLPISGRVSLELVNAFLVVAVAEKMQSLVDGGSMWSALHACALRLDLT